MTYQSMANAHDGMPLLREEGTVEVVDEGGMDELNGSRLSRRSRRGAALGLTVLALGAVSALSALGAKSSSQSSTAAGTAGTRLAATRPAAIVGGGGGGVGGDTAIRSPVAESPASRSPAIGSPSSRAPSSKASSSKAVSAQAASPPKLSDLTPPEKESLFEQFGVRFDKSYGDDYERQMRFEIFKRNLRRIDEKNANSRGPKYDLTMWADLTHEEFKSYQNYGKISDEAKEAAKANVKSHDELSEDPPVCQACTRFPELEQYIEGDLPTEFDWRDYGAVTHVKNQAYCGSCWSFSATGCLEGAWYLSGNPLESLSEQQLVACDTAYNQGCNGGWPSLAMDYISKNGGIVPEGIYPYRKVYMGNLPEPTCSEVVKDGNYAATLSVEVDVAEGPMAEDAMARWLILNGPLSAALDAIGMDYYSEGIDMGEYCTPLEIDHAVLIVGYGEEDGVKFWIIKNSWKYLWGESGYYRLVRGVNACGIADEVTTIIVGDAAVEE